MHCRDVQNIPKKEMTMYQVESPFGGRIIEYSAEGLQKATEMWEHNVAVGKQGKVRDNAKRMLEALQNAEEVVE